MFRRKLKTFLFTDV